MKILMITFVFNEIKYLPHVIDYYKKNGCDVYIIDNYSDDGTYEWLIKNNIPCHRIDTKGAFHVRVLEDDLVATVHKLKPDWVIFGSADLYHITNTSLSEYIGWLDFNGFNQLSLMCISAIPITAEEMNCEPPLPLHHDYALTYQPLTMISKYNSGFYLDGDAIIISGANPYFSNDGVSINYGPCKPVEEQEVKRLRTQKAWKDGMSSGYSVHYEKAKKINWVYPKSMGYVLSESHYYKYILKIKE